jgi:hypothetical protein
MSAGCDSLAAMVAWRPAQLFGCLIALAVAGCAVTGDQIAQTSAGTAPSRPKAVLVYDLEFGPDVVVVDREFTVRLQREIGDLAVNNRLLAKRVNAEIVATIITILRDEAGFNARPGIEDDPAFKDTALIVAGQLRAADRGTRAQRAPVPFSSVVVADMTLSLVSGGAKTQLLAFSTQAQKGSAFTGPSAAAHDAAIKIVLAGESVPAEKLSPDVEAQARGLGRAVADKITAYAMQQGWVNKANLPERLVDTKPTNQRPQKPPVAGAMQSETAASSNTIPCDAFTRNERGNWYVRGPVTIDLGTAQNKTLQNLEIMPKFFTIGGVDLYEAVQKKCGATRRP